MLYGYPEVDASVWKNYLEYTYKDKNDTYKIRFYLGKKNKVTAFFFIKNLENILDYPNKESNPGLTFQAPNGEKITTQKINGKKVNMVPKGTTIKFKKTNYSMFLYRYDVDGNATYTPYDTDQLFCGTETVEPGKSYDLETLINDYMGYEGNFYEPGDYLYYALWIEGEANWNPETEKTVYTAAPKLYYFKFK